MKKSELKSVIQPDFEDLLLTGEYAVHHVFPGRNRKKCEKYGFLVALRPAAHEEIHKNPECPLDHALRRMCFVYWIENIGTEEEFRQEFY